jgi:hypothetical protein
MLNNNQTNHFCIHLAKLGKEIKFVLGQFLTPFRSHHTGLNGITLIWLEFF